MSAIPTPRSTVIPCIHYHDAPAAIDWLCRVFGFTAQLVVPGEGNIIQHAQLLCGSGMIMLGSAKRPGTDYARLLTLPDEIGGLQTATVYVLVPDADAVYARVRAAGAEVLLDIKDEDYGGRGFTCRDLENHVWSFGTYDPYA